MGVMNYWFWRRPNENERDQAWYYFRMVEPDWTPLPVFEALATQAQQPPVLGRGFHQEYHRALTYSGAWSLAAADDAVLGGVALLQHAATVRFTFEGNGLSLALSGPFAPNTLTISIDGRKRHVRRTEIVPDTAITAWRVARGLGSGPHDVVIIVQSGPVALDGIIVYREPARWPWLLLLVPLGLLAGLATSARLRRRRRALS
jgi:hypothetical protein